MNPSRRTTDDDPLASAVKRAQVAENRIGELVIAANSARVLIERHRATRCGSHLLTTALQELDEVLPTYQALEGTDG